VIDGETVPTTLDPAWKDSQQPAFSLFVAAVLSLLLAIVGTGVKVPGKIRDLRLLGG
jgi:hypothetical protein